MEYEYGIGFYRSDPNGPVEDEQGPHRTGMTYDEAVEWIEEWQNYGARKDAFYIIRRPKGDWEAFDGTVESRRRIRSKKEVIDGIRQKAATLPKGPL